MAAWCVTYIYTSINDFFCEVSLIYVTLWGVMIISTAAVAAHTTACERQEEGMRGSG